MSTASAYVYTDFQGLGELKARAGRDSSTALDDVARQFESLFLHQMLKSMRQANLGEGLFDSEQTLFYRDMYDQQIALHLSKEGGLGLAEVIKQQLGQPAANGPDSGRDIAHYRLRAVPVAAMRISRTDEADAGTERAGQVSTTEEAGSAAAEADLDQAPDPRNWQIKDFVEQLWPWAQQAASMLGLQPQALLAQAALETGWGKHVMRFASGQPANNLFGIKADQRWDGDRVSVNTLEYEQGVAVKKRAQFRAYDSFKQSFLDYVDFVRSSPRYQAALEAAHDSDQYFNRLQQAGYATDPEYASKIKGILNGDEFNAALSQLKPESAGSL
jgi:flagellar protein FlgJ